MRVQVSGKLFTFGLITSWYACNIGVILLNKYLLSNYGFRYPIFLTLCHMMACSIFSYIAISWLKLVPMQTIRSRVQFLKISSLGLIFCLSVVGGNISLRYLPVSFNQAVGATTPFFTAVFAYLMTLKREGWLTYITLIPVVTGVIIASGVFSLSLQFPFVRFGGFVFVYCMLLTSYSNGPYFVLYSWGIWQFRRQHAILIIFWVIICRHFLLRIRWKNRFSCQIRLYWWYFQNFVCSFWHSSSYMLWYWSQMVYTLLLLRSCASSNRKEKLKEEVICISYQV